MGGGGDSVRNEAPTHAIKKSHTPTVEGGGGDGSESPKEEDLEENSQIMIYNEQKFDLEIKMLEEWTKICEARRSFAIQLIDEQIEKIFRIQDPPPLSIPGPQITKRLDPPVCQTPKVHTLTQEQPPPTPRLKIPHPTAPKIPKSDQTGCQIKNKLKLKQKQPPPTPLEHKTKPRQDPPNPKNTKMSQTGVRKKWIEAKKNEDGKFTITKCVKFDEPTISTSKKRKKLSKQEKFQKIQQQKFKNFFGKSQSQPDSDKVILASGPEPNPKPDKINIQIYVKKRKYSSEVEDSPKKVSKISDHTKPKSVSTIRKMFEQRSTDQQLNGNPDVSAVRLTNQKQASSKAAKFTTKN